MATSVWSSGLTWYLIALTVIVVVLSIKLTGKPKEDEWYQSLKKPPGMAKEWVFGVAWGILYPLILIGIVIAVYYITIMKPTDLTLLYTGLIILTLLWVYFFFTLHDINLGALVMLILIGVISYTIYAVWPSNIGASDQNIGVGKYFPVVAFFLLLAWILVATYFNIGVAVLNK